MTGGVPGEEAGLVSNHSTGRLRYVTNIPYVGNINLRTKLLFSNPNQTAPDGDGDGFGSVSGAQFAEDGGDVKFDGSFGDVESVCYFFIQLTTRNQGENIQLSGG